MKMNDESRMSNFIQNDTNNEINSFRSNNNEIGPGYNNSTGFRKESIIGSEDGFRKSKMLDTSTSKDLQRYN